MRIACMCVLRTCDDACAREVDGSLTIQARMHNDSDQACARLYVKKKKKNTLYVYSSLARIFPEHVDDSPDCV